jgi:hypothetical protein
MNEKRVANPKSRRRQRKLGRRRKARRALQAARQKLIYTLAARWRKITAEHQEIYRYKKLEWITVEEALCLVDYPSTLEAELKSGRIRCRLQNVTRWWLWNALSKEMWKGQLISPNRASLIDNEQWVLRINEHDCWQWLARKEAAAATTAPQGKPFTAKTAETFVRAFLKDNPSATLDDVRKAGKGRGGRDFLDNAYRKVKEEMGEPVKPGPRRNSARK